MRLLPDLGCFAIVLHLVEQGTSQTVCSYHSCVFSTLQLIHHKTFVHQQHPTACIRTLTSLCLPANTRPPSMPLHCSCLPTVSPQCLCRAAPRSSTNHSANSSSRAYTSSRSSTQSTCQPHPPQPWRGVSGR
jgi:hypothetical protein